MDGEYFAQLNQVLINQLLITELNNNLPVIAKISAFNNTFPSKISKLSTYNGCGCRFARIC